MIQKSEVQTNINTFILNTFAGLDRLLVVNIKLWNNTSGMQTAELTDIGPFVVILVLFINQCDVCLLSREKNILKILGLLF